MEVAFPDWLHGHEHGSLDDAIRQSRHGCFELHFGPVRLWDRPR